ncbi:MAG: hypothetical protein ABI360_00695, partial [Allobranchiibius sp.]
MVAGPATSPLRHPPEEILLGFARALRSAGVGVTQDRAGSFLTATALVGLQDADAVYVAGQATMCAGPDDLDRYDQVFAGWFGGVEGLPRRVPREDPRHLRSPLPLLDEARAAGEEGQAEQRSAAASEVELLRHRDVASLSAPEKAFLDALIAALTPRLPHRRAARRSPWRRGEVDVRRTLRTSMQQL